MQFTNARQALSYYRFLVHEAEEKGVPQVYQVMAELGRTDLFFLLLHLLKRDDLLREDNDWLFQRCQEVQNEPDGMLDLWAREHYKSTIITYGRSIQDILNDPEITICIFSHTRPISKGFLQQIKQEFEQNELLKVLYPDVLWADPKREAPVWSMDKGIVVKRQGNPKESTIEAWGMVDGQPTSKHFDILVYDDVVTRESVTTPEQIQKVNEALELSFNLGKEGGRRRFIGTRYHAHDTYRLIIDRGIAKTRLYPATDTGKVEGEPVLLTKEALDQKRRDMGPHVFGSQMLQDPVADRVQGFLKEWLRFWDPSMEAWRTMNRYITVDPASEKKKDNDYTCMIVWGLGLDQNYYVLDMVRDRLNLTERWRNLWALVRQYLVRRVGYEKYGLQSDIEHFQFMMTQEHYQFNIVALGGKISKPDRIKTLIPPFEQGRIFLPTRCLRTNYEGQAQDLTHILIAEEYEDFPVARHDDMLDCMARIMDEGLKAHFPRPEHMDPIQARQSLESKNFAPIGQAIRRPRVRKNWDPWRKEAR